MPFYSEISVFPPLFFFFFFWLITNKLIGLPWLLSGKESTCQCRRQGFSLWIRKLPWRRKWQPTPVFLPGKFHRQKSLAGYSPWDPIESDTAEWLDNNNNVHFEASQSPVRRGPCYLHQEPDSWIRKHSGKKPRFLGRESARNSSKAIYYGEVLQFSLEKSDWIGNICFLHMGTKFLSIILGKF